MMVFRNLLLCVVVGALGFSGVTESSAQSDNLVRNRLKRIALGEADAVRSELPDLLSEFPNDPGVRLLHAVLVDDAARALPMFEKIVQEYPQSEWADDAQWRVVQIYALRNDTSKAWQELQEYRKQYPDSEFLLFASELVKNAVGPTAPSRRTSVYESSPSVEKPATTQNSAKQPTAKKNDAARKTEPAKKAEPEKKPEPAKNGEPEKKPATTPVPVQEHASQQGSGVFALQVGLYSTRQSAEAEVEKFRTARMRTEIIEKTIDGDTKYAVIIGSYSSREGAEKAKETVEKYCGCTPFIIER